MDNKPVSDPALRNLERTIRLEFERIILSMAIVCVTLEVAIFIYYYLTDNVGQPVNTYVEFRILVPFAINTLLYIITRFSNRSSTITYITKNRVVSFAGLLMCGVISLAHSYFIPLWVFPLFAIVFCSVFHDGFIQIVQSGLSFVFILYAGILHIYDYPDERTYSILCIIIAEVLAVGISILAYRLEIFAGANKFEHGFETDRVTGVYSKKYLIESANEILKNTNELDPCGIAVIDVDDFKKINDEMGNDKGDDVLRALGQVLQGVIDEDTIVGRYGGDTFVIVFENGLKEENFEVLNQIRKDFSKKKFSFMKDTATISGGYAWFDVTMDLDSALKEAEAALSNAKKSGKNMIMTTGESEE